VVINKVLNKSFTIWSALQFSLSSSQSCFFSNLVAVRIVAGIFRMSGHKILKKMVVEHWNEGK
jgi:hypothetical protein